ncbi:hypothetical protein NJF45_16805 [Stenotrophomonas maltophilia]|uniref:hypothetical protein n=1 Tax=Stenotrophomonas maltophilia TaxID=40324 RepID=UPI0020971030|nr:hypothetical protein [Stenotrophomonas maltophilia]MCO7463557.1 hypothetical protein [Stenotrophomonas maltophilia]
MSKKLIAIVVVVAALAVVIGGVWGYRLKTNDAQRKSEGNGIQENTPVQKGDTPALREVTAHELEIEKKISPGSFKSWGPKAYEIIRGHEFRPPGDALAHVKQLMQRSESGDANAAYEIYLTINQCQTFTSNQADELAETAALVGSGGWFLERSERILKECESLVLDQDIYHADWLSKAAAMGSQEAMRGYARSPQKVIGSLEDAIRDPEKLARWKENSLKYLNEMAEQGNVSALADLQSFYTYGRSIVSADPVAALAYARVLNRINPQFSSSEGISEAESALTGQQRAKALTMSEGIFQKCCVLR